MTYGLERKVVIVTGAGNGIGQTTTRKLLGEGAIVVAGDLDVARLNGVMRNGCGRALEIDVTGSDADLLIVASKRKKRG